MFRKEMGVARPGENWGFCSDECDHVEKTFRYDVKFTGIGLISYLSDKKCQELLGVYTKPFFQLLYPVPTWRANQTSLT